MTTPQSTLSTLLRKLATGNSTMETCDNSYDDTVKSVTPGKASAELEKADEELSAIMLAALEDN